jgi:iron complex outermembrane receptor protein
MSYFHSAQRRQRPLLLSSAAIVALVSPCDSAFAQVVAELPAITVTQSRLFDRTVPAPVAASPRVVRTPAPRRTAAPRRAPTPTPVATPVVGPTDAGIVGASTSIITSEQIARSPAATIQEVLAQIPGVQLTNLYGGVNGVGTTVDLRGFGAFASANTLVLINGRRLNDLDLAGVDLSTIPRDSIERIEVTRGNSGAVLYGDNAVGGVINIVTKTGVGAPNMARAEVGVGSFNQRMAAISTAISSGPWSTSFYGNAVRSDGYRENSALHQKNAIGDIRYATPDLSAFVTISGDDQRLGLPGPRTVDPSIGLNQLATARRAAATPFDFADKQGASLTAGFTKSLWNGIDLIVDGGVRDKKQQAQFLGTLPLSPFAASAVDSELLTWSITPRLSITTPFLGLRSKILTGIDYYDATYDSNRSQTLGSAPIHVYNLAQQSVAGYWQQTIGFLPTTDFSYGGRVQRTAVTARDRVDPFAPGNFGDAQALPLDSSETNHAYHVGLEHRLTNEVAVFGRAASAFRTPNVDERVSSGPSFDPLTFASIPGTFTLKTQTSHDVEGGLRFKLGAFDAQTSVYAMDLKNEIQFDPVNFYNRNLDPTRRYGSETSASWRINEDLAFRGGVVYTRAVFREGAFAGNDVPLVSRMTASAGVSYNIWQKYVVIDATARYWTSRRMDNDQSNTQGVIPANATVDLKVSGQYNQFYWSASVLNLFDVKYYDYAVASTFTPGRFNAYPLPGRNFLVKAGMVF